MAVSHANFAELADSFGLERSKSQRPVVAVMGLGFVGAAMATAVAYARDEQSQPYFNVIGLDLPNSQGRERISRLNDARFPHEHNDADLAEALETVAKQGNFLACDNANALALADVIIVDINLDLGTNEAGEIIVPMEGFRAAMKSIGAHVKEDALVLVETTVPPGTSEHIALPEIRAGLEARNLATDKLAIAHSYERVMPGADYFRSITDFWRVYAGTDEASAQRAEAFLKKVIDTSNYPLTRLKSTTASECAKVLENSYRACSIAFMDEWGQFAEAVGIDLFEVINAIRMRPTHSNMRQPGLGVGGYCLTKDPLFAKYAAAEIFKLDNHQFPFCSSAVKTNKQMPFGSANRVIEHFDNNCVGKNALVLGLSYRQDVGDTRYSPSQELCESLGNAGFSLSAYDPLVEEWADASVQRLAQLPDAAEFDAIIFAVAHSEFTNLDLIEWLGESTPYIYDSNAVLSAEQWRDVMSKGCACGATGRGDIS